MAKRRGTKKRLFLSAKRRKKNLNLREYNRCKKADLPFVSATCNHEMQKDKKSAAVVPEPMEDECIGLEGCVQQPSITSDIEEVPENLVTAFAKNKNIIVLNNDTNVEHVIQAGTSQDFPEEPNLPSLNNSAQYNVVGRRIVQFQHFFESLQNISEHNRNFGCNLKNLQIVNENRQGLNSILKLKCNMCNEVFKISTNETTNDNMDTMDINTSSVEGIMAIGCGFYNLEELLSMEIPCMDQKTYNKYHGLVCDAWEKTAIQLMKESAKKEAAFAIENGHVDKNGIPCITVVADGCWAKRSYKTNYNALSGAGAIVGYQTGEVLYLGVKNKFCMKCLQSAENEQAIEHTCWKNFSGSSTSMESTIIVEGFKQSLELYGIKYVKFVADGDSSTYKKILDARPYKDTTVEKIECRNHLLRNYCSKLRGLGGDTRFPLAARKLLNGQILRLRRAVTSAIKYRKSEDTSESTKIKKLKDDIDNSVFHVMGCHDNCENYFCTKPEEANELLVLKSHPEFFGKLMLTVRNLSQHSRSLLCDLDSNVVEQFHSIVAKFVGGKRINYCKGRSYQSRCHAAVVSFNTKRPHYMLHKTLTGKSPSKIKTGFEIRRNTKVQRRLKYTKTYNKTLSRKEGKFGDKDYGIYCDGIS